jgi:hypothetical protein
MPRLPLPNTSSPRVSREANKRSIYFHEQDNKYFMRHRRRVKKAQRKGKVRGGHKMRIGAAQTM